MEDLIREKSRKQEYDPQYILYSENIHKTNDERYEIKRKINSKYDSFFKEEKLYNTIQQNKYQTALETGKNHYTVVNMTNHLKYCQKYGINIKDVKESEYNDFFHRFTFFVCEHFFQYIIFKINFIYTWKMLWIKYKISTYLFL